MKRISFDLETLDTKASALVLSLGAVVFDEEQFYGDIKVNFSIDEQLRWGRTIGGSTLLFWFSQSEVARRNAVLDPVPLSRGLHSFATFLGLAAGERTELWANGQDFDLGILGNLYDTVMGKRPWAYNVGRDMRTIIALHGKPEVAFEGEVHDALADAKHQAKIIQSILKGIK